MLETGGRTMKLSIAWISAIASISLIGCIQSDPAPTFRSFPPVAPIWQTVQATSSLGLLSGMVYCASSSTLDGTTGFPQGYGPLPDGENQLIFQVVASSSAWQTTIASGAYEVSGLPVGVPLQVTASKLGYLSQTQTMTIPPTGQARLDFAFTGGASDSYLLPDPLDAPLKLNLPKLSLS